MSTLYIVRHGQASLFADDYDQLSPLGVAQSAALGSRWLEERVQPDGVWTGELRRQIATASAVDDVFTSAGKAMPVPERMNGFDEYPAEALLATVGEQLRAERPDIAEMADTFEAAGEGSGDPVTRYRFLHRYLEAVIGCWVRGDYDHEPGYPVTWRAWSEGVREALGKVMAATGKGQTAAIFTSGGVVGLSLQTVMEAPDIKAAEVNWRVYNASVSRFTFSGGKRISLDSFNSVSHLAREQLTYR